MREEVASKLYINIFGQFNVRRINQKELEVGHMASLGWYGQRVLAALTLNHDKWVSKQNLANLIWGEGANFDGLVDEPKTTDYNEQSINSLTRCINEKVKDYLGNEHANRLQGDNMGNIKLSLNLPAMESNEVHVDLIKLEKALDLRGELDSESTVNCRDNYINELALALKAILGQNNYSHGLKEWSLLRGWGDKNARRKDNWLENVRENKDIFVKTALETLIRDAIDYKLYLLAEANIRSLWAVNNLDQTDTLQLLIGLLTIGEYAKGNRLCQDYTSELYRASRTVPSQEIHNVCHKISKAQTPDIVVIRKPDSGKPLLEGPDGPVPVGSNLYIKRTVDEEFLGKLDPRQGTTILLFGPRKIGKSSLMWRGREKALKLGMQPVLIDLREDLNESKFSCQEAFYRALMESLKLSLDLNAEHAQFWNGKTLDNSNVNDYLEKVVLRDRKDPLVLFIDSADRIFDHQDYRGDVFGLFRSWHNKRAPDEPNCWRRLILVMAYSTEARLFITDDKQSPFNIDLETTLKDFTLEQIMDLSLMHGCELNRRTCKQLHDLVGGHPYLVRVALHEIYHKKVRLSDLRKQAKQDGGPFKRHLQDLLKVVIADPTLLSGLKSLLHHRRGWSQSQPQISDMAFVQLRAEGVLIGASVYSADVRCGLYRDYFTRHL
jgi:hypothetical protein